LFIAGDFCDNEIGIVSVEAAVVSGLRAARAVQAQVRADQKRAPDAAELSAIPISLPHVYPLANAEALKLLLTPSAALSKAWSHVVDRIANPERAVSAQQMAADFEAALTAPAAIAGQWARFGLSAAQWLATLPYADDD